MFFSASFIFTSELNHVSIKFSGSLRYFCFGLFFSCVHLPMAANALGSK